MYFIPFTFFFLFSLNTPARTGSLLALMLACRQKDQVALWGRSHHQEPWVWLWNIESGLFGVFYLVSNQVFLWVSAFSNYVWFIRRPNKCPTEQTTGTIKSWCLTSSFSCPSLWQNHRVRVPQRTLQARRRSRNQHLHLVCWHHQGSAHPLRLRGPGSGQLCGPQAPRDARSSAAVVWRRRRLRQRVELGPRVLSSRGFFCCCSFFAHTVKGAYLRPRPCGERNAWRNKHTYTYTQHRHNTNSHTHRGTHTCVHMKKNCCKY